jgi:hypothetical protein
MRRQNLDPLERIQRNQVGVTRNNVCCVPAHREFEELIVLWITASRNSHINLDPFRLARQSRQEAPNIFLVYVSKEFFPAENLGELGERHKGKQDSTFLECQFERSARLRVGQEQRTNQNVCIEDAAQLRALEERIQNFRCQSAVFRLAPRVFKHFL